MVASYDEYKASRGVLFKQRCQDIALLTGFQLNEVGLVMTRTPPSMDEKQLCESGFQAYCFMEFATVNPSFQDTLIQMLGKVKKKTVMIGEVDLVFSREEKKVWISYIWSKLDLALKDATAKLKKVDFAYSLSFWEKNMEAEIRTCVSCYWPKDCVEECLRTMFTPVREKEIAQIRLQLAAQERKQAQMQEEQQRKERQAAQERLLEAERKIQQEMEMKRLADERLKKQHDEQREKKQIEDHLLCLQENARHALRTYWSYLRSISHSPHGVHGCISTKMESELHPLEIEQRIKLDTWQKTCNKTYREALQKQYGSSTDFGTIIPMKFHTKDFLTHPFPV